MTRKATPTTPSNTAPKSPPAPLRWGLSAVVFYARHEDALVTVHFLDATCPALSGRLVGVDQYDIFLEVTGETVMVSKHALRYIAPGTTETPTVAEWRA